MSESFGQRGREKFRASFNVKRKPGSVPSLLGTHEIPRKEGKGKHYLHSGSQTLSCSTALPHTQPKATAAENSLLEMHLFGLLSHHLREVTKLILLGLSPWVVFAFWERGLKARVRAPRSLCDRQDSGPAFSACSLTSASGGDSSSALESKYFLQRTGGCSGLCLHLAPPPPWLLLGSRAEATGTGLPSTLAHTCLSS